MMDEEWPLSLEELSAAKTLFYATMSFEDVVKKYLPRVEHVWHNDFSARCACPFHSGGNERTPSLYFSETTKLYHCFACTAHGDVFDFIAQLEGRPWFFVVSDFLTDEDVDESEIDLTRQRPTYSDFSDMGYEMGVRLRDYLAGLKGTAVYKREETWVDWVYKRIDEYFLDEQARSYQQARSFQMQIDREISRKEILVYKEIGRHDNRNNR